LAARTFAVMVPGVTFTDIEARPLSAADAITADEPLPYWPDEEELRNNPNVRTVSFEFGNTSRWLSGRRVRIIVVLVCLVVSLLLALVPAYVVDSLPGLPDYPYAIWLLVAWGVIAALLLRLAWRIFHATPDEFDLPPGRGGSRRRQTG